MTFPAVAIACGELLESVDIRRALAAHRSRWRHARAD